MNYQPESSEQYGKNQIIFSANRISLVGKKDSILLYANKSVSLSSNTSVNVDTKGKFVVEGKRIEFGTNATESLILGTKYNKDVVEPLINALLNLASSLSQSVNGPVGTPNMGLAMAGVQLRSVMLKIKKVLPDTLSKLSFTK